MRIIFDGRALKLYSLSDPDAFHGGTETMVKQLAHGLAQRGHTVHVVTNDLPIEQQRGPNEWWWGPNTFPRAADLVVLVHSMQMLPTSGYDAPLIAMATNGIDPPLLDPKATRTTVDFWPCISETHAGLLAARNPEHVDPSKVVVTGLGVDTDDYNALGWGPDARIGAEATWGLAAQIPPAHGRLLYMSDPARGLWHMLDIFDKLKLLVPEASLHVAYDFDRHFEAVRWHSNALGEMMWDCKGRLEQTEGVTNMGALNRADLIREQLECHVFAYPCDPPTPGSELFCLSAMEAAAAGCPLVLADNECLPEVYGDVATILPIPGTYLPAAERRYDAQDWAEVIAELMHDPEKWAEASRKARALAEQRTWSDCLDNWERMIVSATSELVPA